MNSTSPKKVAYGWVALTFGALGTYIWAKGQNDKRWKEQRTLRTMGDTDKGYEYWKDKAAAPAPPAESTAPSTPQA
ncbi:uncharacterized protein EHS24_009265 [Apiotrichum porosum]|uniref:Uncharacterized protein n=1 Tax=Apiotrichum porosum TaxID=105984 RepID=A0A427XLI7_9TREE|nr:uncharacterized protein EHS24_009265 [Apiotrichum porosum]RSH79614.1 hypothetical protein EHS24_009265 [Apiotrichum porosum]